VGSCARERERERKYERREIFKNIKMRVFVAKLEFTRNGHQFV
jgi:hypothetical protein